MHFLISNLQMFSSLITLFIFQNSTTFCPCIGHQNVIENYYILQLETVSKIFLYFSSKFFVTWLCSGKIVILFHFYLVQNTDVLNTKHILLFLIKITIQYRPKSRRSQMFTYRVNDRPQLLVVPSVHCIANCFETLYGILSLC